MSLWFPVTTSNDRVNHGRVAAVDNLTVLSLAIWYKPDSISNSDRRWFCKTVAAAGGGWFLGCRAADGSAPRINVLYATTNAVANAGSGYLKAGVWSFIAATFDGVAAPKIYVGYQDVPAKETSYASTATPVGARNDDSAVGIGVGNPYDSSGGNAACAQGEIAFTSLSNVVLTLAEIQRIQRDSLYWVTRSGAQPYIRGLVFGCHEGAQEFGKGLQRDFGPYGLHGTIIESTGVKFGYGLYTASRAATARLQRLNQIVLSIRNRRTLGLRVGSRMG